MKNLQRANNPIEQSQIIENKRIMKLDSSILSVIQKIDSHRNWIDLLPEHIDIARRIEVDYPNQYAQYQAFLNHLCRLSFENWLKSNHETQKEDLKISSPELWEFINGFSLCVNNKILTLIPSEAIDTEGFSIEQEWLDIPSLGADFYLPVQVNLEKKFMRIWGFISRADIKKYAFYYPKQRKYLVDRDYLLDDFEVLCDCCQFGESEKGSIDPLPDLSEEEAIELIETLSEPSPYSPRLNVSFEKWGALLNNREWREALYRRKQEEILTKLRVWLEDQFQKDWLDAEQYLKFEPVRFAEIKQRTGNMKKRLKLIDLQVQFKKVSVLLLVAIAPREDGTYRIVAQIHPVESGSVLPPNLGISQFYPSGKEVQTTLSRQFDNWIQLNPFYCREGQKFSLKVFWQNASVVEEFIV
jgi:hypothetical protein